MGAQAFRLAGQGSTCHRRPVLALLVVGLIQFLGTGIASATERPSVKDDLGTPEERLTRAGITVNLATLVAILNDPEADVGLRSASARALGRLRSQAAQQALEQHLTDHNATVRSGVAKGLGSLGDPAVIPALSILVRHDSSGHVRQAAVVALLDVGGRQAFDELNSVAQDEAQTLNLRQNALSVMSRMAKDVEPTFGQLQPLVTSAEPSIRAASAIVLAEAGDQHAVSHLADAAIDVDTPENFRISAMLRFQRMTGTDFGYVGEYGVVHDGERERAIASMREWWLENSWKYEAD